MESCAASGLLLLPLTYVHPPAVPVVAHCSPPSEPTEFLEHTIGNTHNTGAQVQAICVPISDQLQQELGGVREHLATAASCDASDGVAAKRHPLTRIGRQRRFTHGQLCRNQRQPMEPCIEVDRPATSRECSVLHARCARACVCSVRGCPPREARGTTSGTPQQQHTAARHHIPPSTHKVQSDTERGGESHRRRWKGRPGAQQRTVQYAPRSVGGSGM